MFKTVTLSKLNFIFYEKFKKQEKEAGTNFYLLSQWKNLIGRFIKIYLNRPIKILQLLIPGNIQKCLT